MKSTVAILDPRIKRTRQLLHRAFTELLTEKSFEEITVHDIAERSTVNRATFYDHFPDKFALLEDIIADSFQAMLDARMAGSSGTCPESVKQLICAVCDFFTDLGSRCQKHQRQFAPVAESKIKSVLRDFLLIGLRETIPEASKSELELRATMATWAVCGAALEWSHAKTASLETFAESVLSLVSTTLQLRTSGSSSLAVHPYNRFTLLRPDRPATGDLSRIADPSVTLKEALSDREFFTGSFLRTCISHRCRIAR